VSTIDQVVVTRVATDEAYEPFMLPDGGSAGEVSVLREEPAEQRGVRAGFFRIRSGEFPDGVPVPYEFHTDEAFYVVEGHVRIEFDNGDVLELSPGDAASFTKSTKATWTFTAPFAKFFVEN
jgi:uncharacterized protein